MTSAHLRPARTAHDGLKTTGSTLSSRARPQSIRIITHNIRYATDSPAEGEELWPVRCPRLCSELSFNSRYPDETFICLQEVLHEQLLDIKSNLNEQNGGFPLSNSNGAEWSYIGVGRSDGQEDGEYSPIFYRPSIWKVKRWTTMWLSETPWIPSKGWDADDKRIVTIGYFMHLKSGWECVVMSTHLDNVGKKSRAESAKLILGFIHDHFLPETPVFLGGDFNSPQEEEAYKIMTSPDSVMVDSGIVLPKIKRHGHEMTFSAFGRPGQEEPSLIDFVFVNKRYRASVSSYGVLENKFDDGVYNSDHRAVVVDFAPSN